MILSEITKSSWAQAPMKREVKVSIKAWEEREKAACVVDAAFEDAANKRDQFLATYGWDYSCDFPDSCWRFVKVVKGQSLFLSGRDAFDMERKFIKPKNP